MSGPSPGLQAGETNQACATIGPYIWWLGPVVGFDARLDPELGLVIG